MNYRKYLLPLFFLALTGTMAFGQNPDLFSLQGTWFLKLDPQNRGIQDNWSEKPGSDKIDLPGTLTEWGYGEKTKGSDYGILTSTHKYVGPAWYQRTIEIPREWKGKVVQLFLERVLWESRVFIDGKEISMQDGLGTPHLHDLGIFKPGEHLLSIRVNNEMVHNIGDKGHAYGEYTQSIWNGIVGRMELQAHDPVFLEQVRVFSDIKNDKLTLESILDNKKGKTYNGNFKIRIRELSNNQLVFEKSFPISVTKGISSKKFSLPVEGKLKKWSEFNPAVYVLEAQLEVSKYHDIYKSEFGYREVSQDGTKVLINGKPVFLRGNLDCIHFPKTGYPSCKVEDWVRIFKIYKDYGLNHVRYHSWCPPQAAFQAADRVGIYIQAEASIWIDWWMSVDNVKRGRPEMETKGRPNGLGSDPDADQFVQDEMKRMMDAYGNHPSFVMFCIGNELGNSDFTKMSQWIGNIKKYDLRRLYAASTAREITSTDDYCATHYIKGIGGTRGLRGPKTDWDFEKSYSQAQVPIIAHEIGQWPVYPKWREIEKYQGVLKARNLEELKQEAVKNHIVRQDEAFCKASGALNQIMYKYETESFLRTPSCAGVQLLSMQDYQGQGEALIGWLDCHWESKGITTPEKFRSHFTTTVPLLRLPKFVYTSGEIFKGTVQIAHHGQEDLNGVCHYYINDDEGKVLKEGTLPRKSIKRGEVATLGDISFPLHSIEKAQHLSIRLEVEETSFFNEYSFWVYPDTIPQISENPIFVTEELNGEALQKLNEGKKVLLVANHCGTEATSVNAHFYPLYWSYSFFPGQGKTCIGLLVKNDHPAFHSFPTSFHSDWQWETISGKAKGFILNELPADYKPLAQPINDFHQNNKLGSVFELKVGKGKLLVCGYNVQDNSSPVSRQLKHSLLSYMQTERFNPSVEMPDEWLKKTFEKIHDAFVESVPSKFSNAILDVKAGGKLKKSEVSVPWEKTLDDIIVDKATYSVEADGVWKDNGGVAWYGKELEVRIKCPDGILGTVYVLFGDWNNLNREGLLNFEGRKFKLGKHTGEGEWVSFHVMREDSNDGELILKAAATKGPNLMIKQVVLVKSE